MAMLHRQVRPLRPRLPVTTTELVPTDPARRTAAAMTRKDGKSWQAILHRLFRRYRRRDTIRARSAAYLRDQARAQRAAFRAQREQMRYQMRGMRRGSVLGPILLIAIGVVFLLIQTGRLDHDHFWGWYGHWWPLLLVGAGAGGAGGVGARPDRLCAIRNGRPIAVRSAAASSSCCCFFVYRGHLAGNGFSFHPARKATGSFPAIHFDQDSLDELFGDKHESDQTLDVAFAAGGSLTVVNPRGDVTISGTSDDNRIHIAMHKQIYSRTDSECRLARLSSSFRR